MDQKQNLMMMAGFGVLALFQGFTMYRMQSQIAKQNDVIINSARSNKSDGATPRGSVDQNSEASDEDRRVSRKGQASTGPPFGHLAASPAPQPATDMSEAINRLLALQLMNALKQQEHSAEHLLAFRGRSASYRGGSQEELGLSQSGANTISRQLVTHISNPITQHRARSGGSRHDDRVNVTRILLTGGPCAGKTTALAAISQDLTQLGYKVLVVPEAATLIMKGGAMIVSSAFTAQQGLTFQKGLMRLQIALEESFLDIGQMVTDQHVVILIDRGLCDGSAYVSREDWQAVMDDLNMSVVMLRDNRYDAVLHMVTAADGAQKFYASLSNEARYESIDEAVQKDRRLQEAYMGHKNWARIDNSHSTFETKINAAKQQAQRILGHRGGTSFYKKFLLRRSDVPQQQNRFSNLPQMPINLPDGQHFEESEVTEIFINYSTSEGKVIEASIEKKGSNQAFAYTLKLTIEQNKTLISKKRSISASEFVALKANKLPNVSELNCQRICTMEGELYMIIDSYPEVEEQPVILIIQIDQSRQAEQSKRIQLPAYLEIEKEITDLPEFQPKKLSARVTKARNDEEERKSSGDEKQ